MPVSIRITLAQQQSFELHRRSQSRRVDWKAVESLADTADREYFADAPKLPQLWGRPFGLPRPDSKVGTRKRLPHKVLASLSGCNTSNRTIQRVKLTAES
jgi:hypothetical protein